MGNEEREFFSQALYISFRRILLVFCIFASGRKHTDVKLQARCLREVIEGTLSDRNRDSEGIIDRQASAVDSRCGDDLRRYAPLVDKDRGDVYAERPSVDII